MSFSRLAGLGLGAALALGLAVPGQAAPMSHSRNGEAVRAADAPIVKVAAKTHKSSKHAKKSTHESTR
jgi:hypothetical protein